MPFSGTTYNNVSGATTAAAGQVVQSATWNNIHTDIGSALTTAYGQAVLAGTIVGGKSIGVNMNSVADSSIAIALPSGFTRYRVAAVYLSHASASLSASTIGVFTAAAGGGTAIVTSSSSVTVTATTENTNNNMQSFTIQQQNTASYQATPLFFRVTGAEGSAATADVTIQVTPLP